MFIEFRRDENLPMSKESIEDFVNKLVNLSYSFGVVSKFSFLHSDDEIVIDDSITTYKDAYDLKMKINKLFHDEIYSIQVANLEFKRREFIKKKFIKKLKDLHERSKNDCHQLREIEFQLQQIDNEFTQRLLSDEVNSIEDFHEKINFADDNDTETV